VKDDVVATEILGEEDTASVDGCRCQEPPVFGVRRSTTLSLSVTKTSEGKIDVIDKGLPLRSWFVIDTCHSVLSTDCWNCVYSNNVR